MGWTKADEPQVPKDDVRDRGQVRPELSRQGTMDKDDDLYMDTDAKGAVWRGRRRGWIRDTE